MANEQGITDDWTVPSTVDSSFVEVSMEGKEILKVSVSPKHESIGLRARHSTQREGLLSGIARLMKPDDVCFPIESTQVCVTIQASDLPANHEETKSAIDLMVSLDISGSMKGKKLEDCISTLQAMLRPLGPKDRFGLVTFGSQARVSIPACFMTRENKESALKQIKALRTSGCTNLSGGLSLAWQELKLIDEPNAVRSIFLLTDGDANVGVTDTDNLVDMVKMFRVPDEVPMDVDGADDIPKSIALSSSNNNAPVSLFCFGYGTDHNSSLLQAISEATRGGAYYFVEKDADVSTAFGDAMGGLLTVLAQSAVLKITVPPTAAAKGVKILDVHHDEKIQREDGSFTVSLGDFYAEESRDVLFDLELSNSPSDAAVPQVQVTLSYTDIINKKNVQTRPLVCAIARPDNSELDPMNLHVQSQWVRVCTVREMEAADLEAQRDQMDRARDRLKQALEVIKTSPAYNNGNLLKALESDVKEVLRTFQSRSMYGSVGGHYAKAKYRSHKTQRCMASSTKAADTTYQTSTKAHWSVNMVDLED